jgi:PAS domain S-box-containing protein
MPAQLTWLAALLLVIGWRLALPLAQRRGGGAGPGPTQWLRRFRASCVAHGLVWGAAAWLPSALDDPQQQVTLVIVLAGLMVGMMALTLFDLDGALGFVLGAALPLAARLVLDNMPLQPASLVASVMGGAVLGLLSLAGVQSERERRALAAARRAERVSAQGAYEAQTLLREVFEHAGLGISVFDASQRLLAWNQHVADILGLNPALLRKGMPLVEALEDLWDRGLLVRLASAQDRATDIQQRLAFLRQAQPSVTRERRTNGRLTEVRRNPLPGGGFVMFHADITEREAARRAAAEQQHMLSLVLERAEQGFWSIDNQLRTIDANPAMCRMLGLERSQLLGRNIYEIVDAENREIFKRNVPRRDAGEASSYEISLLRSDGGLVHCLNNATPLFDAAGQKVGALGLFSDISRRKADEERVRLAGEALAQKSDVLTLTLDSLVQGVLNVDPEGRCTAWNRRFLELLEIPADVMERRPRLSELLAWQLQNQVFGPQLALVDQSDRDGGAGAPADAAESPANFYRRARADGTVLDVATHFAADGSMVRTYTDVTAAVRAEAALITARDEAERAREQAEDASRAKSEFLSRMSHELRTPLHAILGFAQLMQADPAEPPTPGQQDRLDAMLRGGNHLLALINDVLDVARIDGGHLQLQLAPVDLADVLDEALSLVEAPASARGVLLLAPQRPARPAGLVLADATRLRQVLLNLLTNAIKFNRPGGCVRITVAEAGPRLRLEVADEGAGISPEQLPRLFQAFERLDMDGAVEGTGIGLALSRCLVDLMQGEIGARSQPGEGSVFWLELPRSEAAVQALPEAVPALPAAAQAGHGDRHDVLYIEDNEVNQVLMEGMLSHRPGIALRMATLPEEGLEMALAQPPDLVLLDIQLPGVDGYEVLRRLRVQAALARTPVIAVSANAMPSDLARAQEAGFSGYLTKPLDMGRLLAAVDAALA